MQRHDGADLQMVHLVSCAGQFEARLLAARLGAEGILWQLRGESSVYPIGGVDVLVDACELPQARDLLDAPCLPADLDEWADTPAAPRNPSWALRLAASAVLAGFGYRLIDWVL